MNDLEAAGVLRAEWRRDVCLIGGAQLRKDAETPGLSDAARELIIAQAVQAEEMAELHVADAEIRAEIATLKDAWIANKITHDEFEARVSVPIARRAHMRKIREFVGGDLVTVVNDFAEPTDSELLAGAQ